METRHARARQAGGIMDLCRRWLRCGVCGLHGHDMLPSFEPGRICLRCVSCSYETHGWVLRD